MHARFFGSASSAERTNQGPDVSIMNKDTFRTYLEGKYDSKNCRNLFLNLQ